MADAGLSRRLPLRARLATARITSLAPLIAQIPQPEGDRILAARGRLSRRERTRSQNTLPLLRPAFRSAEVRNRHIVVRAMAFDQPGRKNHRAESSFRSAPPPLACGGFGRDHARGNGVAQFRTPPAKQACAARPRAAPHDRCSRIGVRRQSTMSPPASRSAFDLDGPSQRQTAHPTSRHRARPQHPQPAGRRRPLASKHGVERYINHRRRCCP